MDAQSIIRRADELGIILTLAGDRIRYAPKSKTPEDFVESLREHKQEMLAYLTQNPDGRELSHLLSWASRLAEEEVVLIKPVSYVEAALRTVTTTQISFYAAQYLSTICHARHAQQDGGWGRWTPRWWREREQEALTALDNLRHALAERGERQL